MNMFLIVIHAIELKALGTFTVAWIRKLQGYLSVFYAHCGKSSKVSWRPKWVGFGSRPLMAFFLSLGRWNTQYLSASHAKRRPQNVYPRIRPELTDCKPVAALSPKRSVCVPQLQNPHSHPTAMAPRPKLTIASRLMRPDTHTDNIQYCMFSKASLLLLILFHGCGTNYFGALLMIW